MTYETLRTRRDGRVLYVDFDNPPLNLMTTQMVGELFDLAGSLAFDPETTVVVFGSANPEFFIAHFELNDLIRSLSDPTVPQSRYDDINALQALATRHGHRSTVIGAFVEVANALRSLEHDSDSYTAHNRALDAARTVILNCGRRL